MVQFLSFTFPKRPNSLGPLFPLRIKAPIRNARFPWPGNDRVRVCRHCIEIVEAAPTPREPTVARTERDQNVSEANPNCRCKLAPFLSIGPFHRHVFFQMPSLIEPILRENMETRANDRKNEGRYEHWWAHGVARGESRVHRRMYC
jgi:hypothetical protein